jgi:hypothetical protein
MAPFLVARPNPQSPPPSANLAGVGVGEERQVHDHLLVGHLVALRALDHAVEHQHLAVRRGLEQQHVLRRINNAPRPRSARARRSHAVSS